MIKTISFFADFAISLAATVPKLNKVKKIKEISNEEFLKESNKIAREWARGRLKKIGANIHVIGEENLKKHKTVLFVSNHQSYADIAVFLANIDMDKGFVAKEELIKFPVLSDWMKNINCVFMDRSDLKKSGKAIIDGINILKSGYSMVIFPEGTRSKSSNLLEFKSASLKMAAKAKVPIVPVSLDGTYKILEEHNRIRSAEVFITIHEPIETENIKNNEIEKLSEDVVEIIKSGIRDRSV